MDKLLEIWPSVAELAVDLELPYPTVQSWKVRGIPARRFSEIIAAAERRGQTLTFDELFQQAGAA